MKASQIRAEIISNANADLPMFIWGPPGIGKSETVKQVCDENEWDFCDIRLGLLDPTDMKGLPFVEDGYTRWAQNAEFPQKPPKGKRGIVFLDEFNLAGKMVQGAAYQFILPPHKIGEYQLSPGWYICAAGNRDTDGGVTERMPVPLRTRFVHVEMEVDLDEFVAHANKKEFDESVVAFVKWRTELLFQFDSKSKNERTFPCPRTWEFLSRKKLLNPGVELHLQSVGGIIGDGPAAEFIAFERVRAGLPTFEEIVADPIATELPTNKKTKQLEPAALYALVTTISRRITVKNGDKVMQYVKRLPKEFQVTCIKDTIHRNADLLNGIKAITLWMSDNSTLLSGSDTSRR